MTTVWQGPVATGVGSLPFDDRDEAARIVMGELPKFPHLPELPRRGAGADMIGRAAAILVDLHVDLQPSGWRLVDRPGADERRARSTFGADIDALEVAAYGHAGPLKVQVCGPLTLAATVELNRGGPAVADYGARRDLAESLAEGVREYVTDIARRIPGAMVAVQLDEPALPAVLRGGIPTISGFGHLREVSEREVETLLGAVVEAAGVPVVVHCCAAEPPVTVIHNAGAVAVSLDPGLLNDAVLLDLARAVDEGFGLWPGIVPSLRPDGDTPNRLSDVDLADRLTRLWRRLDQDPAAMAVRTVVTPVCGLSGADPTWVREAYALARSTARAFAEKAST